MVNKITTPPTTSELIGTVNEIIDDKQDTLVSGTNIKTINNTSILGSGNIDIQGGGGSYTAGDGIDITNDVISVDSSIVTTNTVQTITSQKTFNGKISVKDVSNLTGTTILETYAGNTNVGTSNTSLLLKSNLTRPYFNNTSTQLALLSDVPTDTSDLTNGAGYITGITSSDITTALGYTPYDSSNPNGYITNSALTPYVLSADLASVATSGSYNDLSDKPTIPSAVTEATVAGWGFTKNIGTVTSVNNVSPVNGNVTLSIPTVPTNVSAFTNDSGYITSSALNGYATENWVGQQGYITGITSSDVTTALGYTPYNSSNPNGYITSSALTPYVLSSSLATVATSGDYNDLTNKPDLTTKADVDLSNLNATGKSLASGLGMPSNRYIDLTLGASGTTYTAPASGLFYLNKSANGSGQYILMQNNSCENWQSIGINHSNTAQTRCSMMCKKGDIIMISYTVSGSTNKFKFIYAQGEN